MTLLCLLYSLIATAPSAAEMAEVRLLDGRSVSGTVQSITPEQLKMEAEGAVQTFSVRDVLSISWNAKPVGNSQQQEIRLTDGSVISCQSLSRTAREVTGESDRLGSVSITAAAVTAVRLQPLTESSEAQWAAFLKRETDKDLLVVPKRDGSGLDFLAGIVSSIGESESAFLLDGDTIPVPTSRIFGVVFAEQPSSPLTGSTRISTLNGERFLVSDFSVTEGQLSAVSSWGQSVTLPLDQLSEIDLSGGRIHYLSDMEPVAERFFGLDPDGDLFSGLIDPDVAGQLYGPARNQTIEGGLPLRLRGVSYARGMCIHSRTELVFAVDQKYSSFEAVAGVDDEVAFNLDRKVLLVISGDSNELYRHTFGTADDPITVSVPLQDVQTLTILVDYADNNSQCDWLDLADARLILASEENN